jgi:hypothetical protein
VKWSSTLKIQFVNLYAVCRAMPILPEIAGISRRDRLPSSRMPIDVFVWNYLCRIRKQHTMSSQWTQGPVMASPGNLFWTTPSQFLTAYDKVMNLSLLLLRLPGFFSWMVCLSPLVCLNLRSPSVSMLVPDLPLLLRSDLQVSGSEPPIMITMRLFVITSWGVPVAVQHS